jgi:DNA-binding transcriptional regulator YiaG
MRLTFVETPEFQSSSKGHLADEQIRAVQDDLLENPEAGDLVSGTNFRKIRVSLAGRGKRGGGRVVYYYVARAGTISPLFLCEGRHARPEPRRQEIPAACRGNSRSGDEVMARRKAADFEQMLLRSGDQAVAIARGERVPGRVTVLDSRDVKVVPPPSFTAERIQSVRRGLQLSQPVFAKLLNVSVSLVRAWERGAREPEGASQRLLQVTEREGSYIVGSFTKRRSGPGSHATTKRLVAQAKKTRRAR